MSPMHISSQQISSFKTYGSKFKVISTDSLDAIMKTDDEEGVMILYKNSRLLHKKILKDFE